MMEREIGIFINITSKSLTTVKCKRRIHKDGVGETDFVNFWQPQRNCVCGGLTSGRKELKTVSVATYERGYRGLYKIDASCSPGWLDHIVLCGFRK